MSKQRPRRTQRLAAVTMGLSLMFSLVVVGVVGSAVNANAAYTTACSGATDTHFSDNPGTAANCLFDYGIALGKSNGTFGEDDDLVRSQFASFVTRFLDAAGVAHTARTTFPDVNSSSVPDANVLQEIEEGHAAGVVNGYSAQSKEVVNAETCVGTGQPCQPGDFGPEHNMSVAQACTIILHMMDVIHAANSAAPAGNSTGDPGTDYNACVSMGILDLNAKDAGGTTYPNGPTDTIKRGLFADMLAQTLQKEVDAGVIPNAYASNQQFQVSPAGDQILSFTRTTEGGTGIKSTNVTFSGLDNSTQYDVALFPCATPDNMETGNGGHGTGGPQIQVVGGKTIFRDADTNGTNLVPDRQADNEGESTDGDLEIASINGAPYGGGSNYEDSVSPDAGKLLVNVSNAPDPDYGDCAFIVVFDDSNGNDELDLNTDGTPTEDFAVSGAQVWTSHEAPNGEDSSYDIVWKVGTTIYTDSSEGYSFIMKNSDNPEYQDGQFAMTPADWLKQASLGDSFDFDNAGYSRTTGSNFDLYADYTDAPQNVAAQQGDFDSGAGSNDVKLTWTAPTDGTVAFYNVYDETGFIGSTTADETFFVVSDPVAGTEHTYRVSAVSQAGQPCCSTYESDRSVPLKVTPTVSSKIGPPLSASAVHTDGNSDGIANNGDILINTFDENMNAPASDAQLVVCDADGTCALFQNGTNATMTKIASNRIITTITAAGPIIVANGTNGTLDYAGTGLTATNLGAPANTHGYTDSDESLEWDPTTGGQDSSY